MASTGQQQEPAIISAITVISLSVVLSIIGLAFVLNKALLPRDSAMKIRLLFIWHMFDAIVHFLLEGSYLCKSSYKGPLTRYKHSAVGTRCIGSATRMPRYEPIALTDRTTCRQLLLLLETFSTLR